MTKTQGVTSDEPKYFRCSDKKKHLVSVFVCLHKGCVQDGCGFHLDSLLRHSDNPGGNLGVSEVSERPEPSVGYPQGKRSKNKAGIKASRKKVRGSCT